MKLPQLQQDKANHFIYGAIISSIVCIFMIPYAGWYIATGVGMVKEFTDDEFNAHDMLATSAGGLFISITILLSQLL
jgi:hypothetical protein